MTRIPEPTDEYPTVYCNERVRVHELRLADHVILDGVREWSTAIVKQIKDGQVTFWRPYGTNEDFSYTGGVICLMGLEEFTVGIDSSMTYNVIRRQKLR